MDNQISPAQVHLATKKDCYDLKFFLENRLPESCDVSQVAECYTECVFQFQLNLPFMRELKSFHNSPLNHLINSYLFNN